MSVISSANDWHVALNDIDPSNGGFPRVQLVPQLLYIRDFFIVYLTYAHLSVTLLVKFDILLSILRDDAFQRVAQSSKILFHIP